MFIKQKRCILEALHQKSSGELLIHGVALFTIGFNFHHVKEPLMPTVSIKLADETKRRLDNLAASQGIKPHALRVGAIESTLSNADQQPADGVWPDRHHHAGRSARDTGPATGPALAGGRNDRKLCATTASGVAGCGVLEREGYTQKYKPNRPLSPA